MIGCTELIPGIGDFHGGNSDSDDILIGVLKGVLEICANFFCCTVPKATIHIHNLLPQIVGVNHVIKIKNLISPTIRRHLIWAAQLGTIDIRINVKI